MRRTSVPNSPSTPANTPISPVKAASTRNTAVGITTANSVVIVTKDVAETPSFAAHATNSPFRIDEKVVAAFVGVSGDARPLANGAQQKVAQKRFEVGEPPAIEYVAHTIGDQMAKAAKHAKLTFHPFAVSALVGGIDGKTPALFRIDTTIKTACSKAAAIGSGAAKAQAYLDEHYTDGLNKAGAVALAVKAILQTGTLAAEEAEIAVISVEKGFSTYSLTEKRNAIDDVV